MAKEGRSPIGQGRDDCPDCHGVGLVGSDGAACACVIMGGTKEKPEQKRDGAMRLVVALRRQEAEPLIIGMLDGLEAVQLTVARQYIEIRWYEFKRACAVASRDLEPSEFIECLERAGFHIADVAETVVLE